MGTFEMGDSQQVQGLHRQLVVRWNEHPIQPDQSKAISIGSWKTLTATVLKDPVAIYIKVLWNVIQGFQLFCD